MLLEVLQFFQVLHLQVVAGVETVTVQLVLHLADPVVVAEAVVVVPLVLEILLQYLHLKELQVVREMEVVVLVHLTMVVEAVVVQPIQGLMALMLKVVKVEMAQQHI